MPPAADRPSYLALTSKPSPVPVPRSEEFTNKPPHLGSRTPLLAHTSNLTAQAKPAKKIPQLMQGQR